LDQQFFVASLEDYLNAFNDKIPHIFCDDININLHVMNFYSVKYQNILSLYGFKLCINEITRNNIINNNTFCIHHIFLKSANVYDIPTGYIYNSNITNHYSTMLIFNKTNVNIDIDKNANIKNLDYVQLKMLKNKCK
jgi:hypothetical protein